MVEKRKAAGESFLVRKAGKGTGPTRAQLLLQSKIGGELEHVVSFGIKIGSVPGWPCSYTIDIAFPEYKLGFEVDGESHRSPKARIVDARRDERLAALGWKIVRFWNKEVLEETDRVVWVACAHRGQAELRRVRGVLPRHRIIKDWEDRDV